MNAKLKDALEVTVNGKRLVMEVSQHIGNRTVRCIMLAASEGLHKDMEVVATGGAISVPVGKKCLGSLFYQKLFEHQVKMQHFHNNYSYP